MNRHKKPQRRPALGFGVNEINFGEEIVMSNNSTVVSNVIPFNFGKQQVRTLLIDDQPWFVAADICQALAICNVSLAVNGRADRETDGLDEDEKGIATVNTPSGAQEMLVVNESGLYALIFKSRKAEARRFKKWVTAEVLPAIRKHGRYEDQGKMLTLMDELIGMSELSVIKGLIRDKAKAVPSSKQQSFVLTMHSRLHTRFNVPRTELIPASQFEQACNFIGSYMLEGEFLPKGSSKVNGLPDRISLTERFLVFADPHGGQQAHIIPREACVMTHQDMIKAMVSGNLMVSTAEMFEFVAAATENLRIRSLNQARRTTA
ncbi:Bro-N domain-containing protein [Pseudomonas protegens]|uniref:BRO-N domain-containing protein n=1 Tax=Pseudomonas protegens TaxID=380021 RepID=UPI00381318DA